jgi:hypothetical protein
LAVVTPVDYGTEELSPRVMQESGQSEKETETQTAGKRERVRERERERERAKSREEKCGHNGDGDDVVHR